MESKKPPIGFILIRIITEQFAIISEAFVEGERIHFSVHVHFNIDSENKIIAVVPLFKFDQGKTPFLIIESSCHFKIDAESWNTFKTENTPNIKINKGFLSHLAMIAVGTARGILHAKTEATKFNQFIIPTINVVELIKDDIIL